MHMDGRVAGMVNCREQCHGRVLVGRGDSTLGVATTDSDVLTQTIVLFRKV